MLKSLYHHLVSKSSNYWLTRFVFLRLLGFVYGIAFLSLALQVVPLVGEKGLLPAKNLLESIGSHHTSSINAFIAWPTLFWIHLSDNALLFCAWLGVFLSLLVIVGFANAPLMSILWFLYLSFVHIGQLWYGYGWEIQLLETGFLAIFFVPFLDGRPFPKSPPPLQIIWLLRWLTLRIYLGAGLIKLRGDACWKELTCLFYHYETQPIPNPISQYIHFLPQSIHKIGVLWNHFVELIVPFFVFWSRRWRIVAGIILASFQIVLIISGNLSFLNWITLVAVIGCFDDTFFKKILPKSIIKKAEYAATHAKKSKAQVIITLILFIIISLLSISVILNLIGPSQIMNTSFNRLHLVNTYGAFGSVGKERLELIVEGTTDEYIDQTTEWKEYEFKAKPGNISRTLPFIAPYQPRIDWQIWFAAMSTPQQYPWVIHLVWKLLHNDPETITLIEKNPFQEKPPQFIRVSLYKYEFLSPAEKEVWKRTYKGEWLPPLSTSNKELKQFIKINNWQMYEK